MAEDTYAITSQVHVCIADAEKHKASVELDIAG